MTTEKDRILGAMDTVAVAVGSDIAYVVPTDERHFDPMSIGVLFGGMLLSGYLEGLVAGINPQRLGRQTWEGLRARVGRLFGTDRKLLERETAEDLARLAAQARAAAAAVSADEFDAKAAVTREALVTELVDYGMPERRARRIAEAAAREGSNLLAA